MNNKQKKRYKIKNQLPNKISGKLKIISLVKLIRDWSDLAGLENENYRIIVNKRWCNGSVISKNDEDFHIYLSTHTFYKDNYQFITKQLKELGFNVQLMNWDGETIYCN